jgi:cell division protein FtsB
MRRSAPVFLVVIGLLVVWGLAFAYLRQSSALLRLTAQREELRDTLNATLELNSVFADELAHLHALPAISAIARDQLGMVKPDTVTYIVLQDDQP